MQKKRFHKQQSNIRSGFTIVELLVVVVVIGILAVAAIVAYSGIQQRAQASIVQSALAQANKKLELYLVDNGSYPADFATFTTLMGTTTDTSYQYTVNNSTSPATYCVTATIGATSYKVDSVATSPASGACAGHGSGGVAAITNLAVNPSAEVNVLGWGTQNATLSTSTAWAASGSRSFMLTSTGSTSSDMRTGSASTFALSMQAGNTYLISATVRLTAAQIGSLSSRARAINVGISTDNSSYGTTLVSSQALNNSGVTRLSLVVPIPSNATGVLLYLGNGSNNGADVVWWDGIMVTHGSTLYNYSDGNSPGWAWNGSANNSTSTGPPL